MKAFVIKVKENCYWLGGFYGKDNYDDIAHAKVYVNKTQAEKQCKLVNKIYGHNAKVVEITMAESNLEQQLTKQICAEIRQALNKEDFWLYGDNNKIISIREDKFNEILDQIEKGKESINGR